MAFKKGDTLVCVKNDNVERLLTKGKKYSALADADDGFVVFIGDTGVKCYAHQSHFALAEGHIELESEPMRVSIELSVLETCVQLLDEIRKPTVQYHRDPRILMQSVIDTNSSNAELVANYLKRCLPKNGERG